MTVIDLPRRPAPASIEWSPNQPSQMNRSEFTRATRTTVLGGGSYWTAKVTLPPIIGEVAFRPWRSAILRLRGRTNAFRLSACEGPQHSDYQAVVVDGAGQQGFQLATRGWARGVRLLDGMFITVGNRLLQVAADTPLAGADGKLTLKVEPYIPAGLLDGAAVETWRPWALMRLTNPAQGWKVSPGQQYSVELECEEA